MADTMRLIPLKDLVRHIVREFSQEKSIFGIPEVHFYRKKKEQYLDMFGESALTPVGPAAGPHTQLAANLAASYLTGGRVMELKTVQQLDHLDIEKPCIDARDHGFNTEWSTELTLNQAWGEYAKGWILCSMLEAVLGVESKGDRSFIFNMSVGYDLAGIQTEKMTVFIHGMMDGRTHPGWEALIREWEEILGEEELWAEAGWQEARKTLLAQFRERGVDPVMSRSVTLSTMHGCPPDEIEAIARYMMEEKGLHTLVKLNPTLLGYSRVRGFLDQTGFGDVRLNREDFEKDLQLDDAVAMLRRLIRLGREKQRFFGVKLTNTLGNINTGDYLPGDDRYMSGRALLPLALNTAALISREFDGRLPISYCGGAGQLTVVSILETGIAPVTVATDLLKPGGYKRMTVLAELAEGVSRWGSIPIDDNALEQLAAESIEAEYSQRSWRGSETISIEQPLPLFNCAAAPCRTACPVAQDIPHYLRLVGEGLYDEALDLIWSRNPLPHITSWICDHQCMANCTRLDYEGPVAIREMKKIAAQRGHLNLPQAAPGGEEAAVIGAGPAGLAAAAFLTRMGFHVTVLEKERDAGGVIRHILPEFRLPPEELEADIRAVQQMGAVFRFGVEESFRIGDLKNRGYQVILLTGGAPVDNRLDMEGEGRMIPSLEFLRRFREANRREEGSDREDSFPGAQVAVVGGGNTAMDSARAAVRTAGVEKVRLFYRRELEQMPADREEYAAARADGVEFHFLAQPEAFEGDGRIRVRSMKLGDPDSSGRPRPVPAGEVSLYRADTVITAVGEKPDFSLLREAGLPLADNGWIDADPATGAVKGLEGVFLAGDILTGPATVIEAVAGARRAAEAAGRPFGKALEDPVLPSLSPPEELEIRKGRITEPLSTEDIPEYAHGEAQRCLECSQVCSKCVEVCPNRANAAVPVPAGDGLLDTYQILHIDAYCNECGNCTAFCPWQGRPFADKLTLFSRKEDFENAGDRVGFVPTGREDEPYLLRLEGAVHRVQRAGGRSLSVKDSGPLIRQALRMVEAVERRFSYLLDETEAAL